MKVTLITTCLNRVEFIHDAIKSVLAQDYPDIEYVIVDGASNDGSAEVIREELEKQRSQAWVESHPNFTFKFISEPDNGLYDALNKGIRVATGDIIGMVHSDDYLFDSHTISAIVKHFEDTQADFVYANGLYVDYKDLNKIVRNWKSSSFRRSRIERAWLPLHTTCYIRRDKMEKVGPYDTKYKIAGDTDFLIRALYEHNYKVSYLDRYVVTMRMGGMSTSCGRIKKMWDEDIAIFAAHGFHPVLSKLMKMARKIPQFITAFLSNHKLVKISL